MQHPSLVFLSLHLALGCKYTSLLDKDNDVVSIHLVFSAEPESVQHTGSLTKSFPLLQFSAEEGAPFCLSVFEPFWQF